MTRLTITAFFWITLLIWGCGENTLVTNEPEPQSLEGENFTLIINSEMYKELHEKKSGEVSEDFEITDVSRTEKNGDSYLQIEIKHHTCDPQTRIIWDGSVAESHPPQAFLFVQLLAGETCSDPSEKKEQKERLLLNLSELLPDEYTVKHTQFSVFNASGKNTDNGHADDPVHSAGS